jgi:hypothetical protein
VNHIEREEKRDVRSLLLDCDSLKPCDCISSNNVEVRANLTAPDFLDAGATESRQLVELTRFLFESHLRENGIDEASLSIVGASRGWKRNR